MKQRPKGRNNQFQLGSHVTRKNNHVGFKSPKTLKESEKSGKIVRNVIGLLR